MNLIFECEDRSGELFVTSLTDNVVTSLVPLQVIYPHEMVENQFSPLIGVEQNGLTFFESDVENDTMLVAVEPSFG